MLLVLLMSNRPDVTVKFQPFGEAKLPLGALLVGGLIIGFIAGLLFHLPARISATRRARRAEKRAAEIEAQANLSTTAPRLTPEA